MTAAQRMIIPSTRGPQRDKPRRETMRRVRVTFREELGPNAQTVIAGHCLRKNQADDHGSVPFTAYESDIERIKALVEDDADGLRRARDAYVRKLHKEIRDTLRADRGGDFEIPDDMSLWDADMKKVEQGFGGSVEAEFFNLTGRGVKPLTSVEVDDEELDPPMSEHEESVAAVAKRFGSGGNVAEVIAQLAELGVLKLDGAATKTKRSRKPKSDANSSDD